MQAALPLLMAAGPIVQGVAGYQAGRYNKQVAGANAQAVEAEGAEQALRIRNAARVHMGRQIGAQAESGFEIGTGTAIDSLIESATNAELEAMEARRAAASRATAYRLQGRQAGMEGKNALIASLFSGAAAAVSAKQDYAQASGGGG